METGKGPSGCTVPGVPSGSGVSQQVDSCLLVPGSTTGFVLTGPTVGWLGIPVPCQLGPSGPATQSTRDHQVGL